MAKKVKTEAEGEALNDDLATLQAKHDALADEVLTLRELVELYKEENREIRAELETLRSVTTTVANSASIAPPPPAAPERPVVEIGGEQYRFRIGAFRIGNKEVRASNLVDDEERLQAILDKYPSLLEKL